MPRYTDKDELPRVKFHPLPYTHITPADIEDAEAYKRGWNDAIDAIIENQPTVDELKIACDFCRKNNYVLVTLDTLERYIVGRMREDD